MAYPETFSVFSDIPKGFPENYSEITDPYLIWNFDIRTLTYYPSSSNNSQATTLKNKVIEIKEIVSNLQADLSEIKQNVSFLKDAQAGNWEITDNQMIFYGLDGSELMRFDLYNRNGQKTSRNVVKRIKV